ncbi:hypothetical protein NB311A_15592 [Nitrobacter sp. Nb-311A]|nr:hypothetical protein NB311A_15592 [Nitrobacter sp. Nb-311A]
MARAQAATSHARTTHARTTMVKSQMGEDIMTDATKRTASGTLADMIAHVTAVTALLIIAACVFYVR